MRRTILHSLVLLWFAMQTGTLSAQEKLILKEEVPEAEAVIIDERELPLPPPPAGVKLSEDELETLMEFYQQIDPDIRLKLAKLKLEEAYLYQHKIAHLYHEQEYLSRLEKELPERYKEAIEMRRLEAGTEKMAELYHRSDDEAEQKKIESDLRATLGQLFDLREKEKVQEIDRIRGRLERLEQEMKERRKNRDMIITNRLNELTGKRSYYEW